MSMKSSVEHQGRAISAAWAAGFLDGNGCLSISRQQLHGRKNMTYRLWIRVVQTSEATLRHFQELLDTPSVITLTQPQMQQRKRFFTLIYECQHALSVLQKLQPYLVLKADQADSAMRFWQEGRMGTLPGPRGFEQEVWDRREHWFNEFRRK